MANPYLEAKSAQAARLLTKNYNVDFAAALKMTTRLWDEARATILRTVSPDEWKRLSQSDKAAVCTELIRALTDKKKLLAFLNGERGRLC